MEHFLPEFRIEDFDMGDDPIMGTIWHLEREVIPKLNEYRDLYYNTKNYRWIQEIIRIIPRGYKGGII